jgi:vacuolar-type H+-ATPase subunit H
VSDQDPAAPGAIAASGKSSGGAKRVDEILERILNIESEARAIVSEAQELATMLKQQAEENARELRAQAREKAEQEARALHRQVEQEVEETRARILARAAEQPEEVQDQDRFAAAVSHIVELISGQREGEA